MSEGKSVGFRLSAREAKKLNIIEKGKLTTLIYLFFFFLPSRIFCGENGPSCTWACEEAKKHTKERHKREKKKKKKSVTSYIT